MNFKKNFKIGHKRIGLNSRALIVAEISANHNQNLFTTKKLITSAIKNGADVIKIQTYTADSLTLNLKKKDFIIKKDNAWGKDKYLWKLYKRAETSADLTKKIFKFCKSKKIIVFSTPFDLGTVDLLEKLNCPAYKIASPEITHIPLIEKIASTKKPIILSLGLSSIKDTELALKTIKKKGNLKVAILQCVASYPAEINEQNLLAIKELIKKYNIIVGLSDHTLGYVSPITSVALGAKIIEKHFNIKKNNSPDSFFSTNEDDFNLMVKNIRLTEASMGNGKIKISKSSKKNYNSRRSIYVSSKIQKGELITNQNIKIVRPGYGLHPKFFKYILNKKSKKTLKFGDRFKLKYVDDK